MQIQHFQFGQFVDVFDFVYIVFGKQQNFQVRKDAKVFDLSDVVIVEIEVEEVRERYQVL